MHYVSTGHGYRILVVLLTYILLSSPLTNYRSTLTPHKIALPEVGYTSIFGETYQLQDDLNILVTMFSIATQTLFTKEG